MYFQLNPFIPAAGRKQIGLPRLDTMSYCNCSWNSVMTGRTADFSEAFDRKTSRSICEAVGERLQRSLQPDGSHLPGPLAQLMNELRERDEAVSRFD
jgi:hypothetical protein